MLSFNPEIGKEKKWILSKSVEQVIEQICRVRCLDFDVFGTRVQISSGFPYAEDKQRRKVVHLSSRNNKVPQWDSGGLGIDQAQT